MESTSNQQMPISGPAKTLSYLEIVLGIVSIVIGLSAIVGAFVGFIMAATGLESAVPAFLLGWPFQALVLIGIGYASVNNGRAMLGYDTYAFSSSFYMDIFLIIVALTIGPLGFLLIGVSLLCIILLFVPAVKAHWYEEFREDMGPRTKEFRYSLHLVRKSPLVVAGIIIVVVIVSIALLAPYITSYGPEERTWTDSSVPPGTVSKVPKFSTVTIYSHNRTDVELYPTIYAREVDVGPQHLQVLEENPSVYFSVIIQDAGAESDLDVLCVAELYAMDYATFNASTPSERQAALIGTHSRNNTMRTDITVGDQPAKYTWVVWFNATQKTSTWSVDITIQLRYNYWYPVHYWGTDDVGGDIYSRIVWAAKTDLRISVTIVIVAVSMGAVIGAASGYYGGKLDELVMRITDVFFAFPGLILAMAIVMALGERSLDNISLALMVTWWPVYARLVRGQVLAEREKLYVEAARSVGASDSRILFTHIIPNTFQPLIVQATMDTGGVLLTAAGLSYIGFGPPAGVAEWGLMISIGQQYLTIAPWMSLFPGLAILVTALAFNLVGDGIRDILDPKLRRR
ncbi:MAG: hypothetical protein DRO93_06710 [Candidatus Thorarchaeota archaeon]|nr:MAG: hypothetical protein DRO93_06710 [Candidatus Thorarchaeota archaeon]